MDDQIENLRRSVSSVLAGQKSLTDEDIQQWVENLSLAPFFKDVTQDQKNSLIREMQMRYDVIMEIGSHLEERGFVPWLPTARATIDPYYWNRYRELLINDKNWSGNLVASLDDVTDRILGLMQNPQIDGRWDRRGLVIGHVQSGKTANYVGLVNKAADAGYKVIVIIAGIHNNLRNQTQMRVDEGFVGVDSARLLSTKRETSTVGVGRYDARNTPATFTNSQRDFTKAVATSVGLSLDNLKRPAVFVIKKNSTTLKQLIEWLHQHNAKGNLKTIAEPLLLIDDEADNASINVRPGSDEVSRINGLIREFLSLFERKCYVGYTATPFANIFIDPDAQQDKIGSDLFPRDFIVSLDPPTNYFGPERVFDESPDSPIRFIEDHETYFPLKHRIDHPVKALPGSLKEAIHCFVLARAIRISRGQAHAHNSMLVNVSRFTGVQSRLRDKIHQYVVELRDSIRSNAKLPVQIAIHNPVVAAIHSTWKTEYSDLELSWQNLQPLLLESIAPINVVEVNSSSSGSLNYSENEQDGLNVIAVGGFSLSRGLTLEGLSVSYFLRNSQMYDTLMQMGRWFGYRPGYDDLCRVWMLEEAAGWYTHISEATEELRSEIRTMESVNATPKEFGLRVRAHPTSLLVTARNKLGSSERITASIGLGGQLVETVYVSRNPTVMQANRNSYYELVSAVLEAGHKPVRISTERRSRTKELEESSGSYLFRGIGYKHVTRLLSAYQNHPRSILSSTEPILSYIEPRSFDELAKWDVLIPSVTTPDAIPLEDEVLRSLGLPIVCQRRNGTINESDHFIQISKKNRVSSRGIDRIGMSEMERKRVEDRWLIEGKTKVGLNSTSEVPDSEYRKSRNSALLVLHFLAIGEPKLTAVINEPVPAWSICFPATGTPEQRVDYVVTQKWKQENLPWDELDEDEYDIG